MNKEEIKDKIRELKTHRQEVWTDIEILQHDRMLFALEKMLLKQENKQLQERVAYLERSNNRREDEILSLRQELNDSNDKIDKAISILENIYYLHNVTISNNACMEIDKAIKELKGEKQ